jgi:hypothetical protein
LNLVHLEEKIRNYVAMVSPWRKKHIRVGFEVEPVATTMSLVSLLFFFFFGGPLTEFLILLVKKAYNTT